MEQWKQKWLDPDWKIAYKLHSVWIAGFWGAAGIVITVIAPLFVNLGNVWWTGPILVLAGVSFAIARFTNQPGAV